MPEHRHEDAALPSPDDGGHRPRRLSGPVLAGVTPGQGLAVVHRAADLAHSLGVGLVCAWADPSTFAEHEPGGRVEVLPIDPDIVDDDAARFRSDLYHGIRDQLMGTGVDWRFAALSGETAHALDAYAAEVGASLIVVGTREHGLDARFEERIAGSVAVRLAHRQDRPVVVIPLGQHHHRRHRHGEA
ncbi:universal stress protein [Sinomonas sp.]|jgi:nucleotide-binding universal stress UspA family protein|uniref:universal stress protein n=1 Tax=Sinomonas sp. TaxID=1914986 RepID=UPI002FE08277